MHQTSPASTVAGMPTSSANCPTAHDAAVAALVVSDSSEQAVGQVRHSHSLMDRAATAMLAMSAGRALSDREILQHEADCRLLAEAAYQRFEDCGDPAEREAAVLWLDRATQARKSLTPSWQASREAQIQQAIAQGTGCFFMDQADRDRRVAGA